MDSFDCGNSNAKDNRHTIKKVTLTFRHPVTFFSDLETEQSVAHPTHVVYAEIMVQKLSNELNSKVLDPTCLQSRFQILLPAEDSELHSGYSMYSSTSLYCTVALAVNISKVATALVSSGSIQHVLSCLVQATQVQTIVAMSPELNGCNQNEVELPLRYALQQLATKLSTTIYVHGDVNSIAESTESIPLLFEPKQQQYALEPSEKSGCLVLGSGTPINLVFSEYVGKFWALVPKSIIEQYSHACKNNAILKALLDEYNLHHRQPGAFAKKPRRSTAQISIHAGSGIEQLRGLCSSLHKIIFEQNKERGTLHPAFTQLGILRILANQTVGLQNMSTASLVVKIDALSNQALPDLPDLDRAIGMVLGLHFFDPACTNYFLCESAALLSNWYPQPEQKASFQLDCAKFCSDCALLLCNMGPPGSQLAPSAMLAGIAAAAVLATAMPVDQALDCWKSFNSGLASVCRISTGIKSAGIALISLLAFVRQPSERLQSSLEHADQLLHCFFEQMQSEDQGLKLLQTLFLSEARSDNPSLCCEDSESIGQVLEALQLVCQNQDLLQCLAKIEHGKPSASIVGLVVGALLGVSGINKMSDLPCIHHHQAAQLRAITSILANCYEVQILSCVIFKFTKLLFDLLEHLNQFCLQIVLKSSLKVSATSSGSLMGQLQKQSICNKESHDCDLPVLKLFLQGPSSIDHLEVGSSLPDYKYQGKPSHGLLTRSHVLSTCYLDHWIGVKFKREELLHTLSTCNWACPDSDLSCLRKEDKWLTEEVLNCFMCLVSANRPDVGCFSTFFYVKLHNVLQSKDADLQSGLTGLCRWVLPKEGTRNLKSQYFVPINIENQHYTFVHADLRPIISPEPIVNLKSKAKQKARPVLTYYDSYHGKLPFCLENLELFFQRLAEVKDYPELQGIWEKKIGKGPTQTDGCNCGLFVCAGIDCLSSGISPAGYGTSTMPAFRAEVCTLFADAGLGRQS